MNRAHFRFYEELNEFLPLDKRKTEFVYQFPGDPSVKDAIEAIGVPHVEVDLILVNGISVTFSRKIRDGDRVSVYPVFESIDVSQVTHLRPKPLHEPRFILDVHLGRLAKYLRLCGFDTLYSKFFEDLEIIETALGEKRIILTRDRQLIKNGRVTHGYWIRSQNHNEQLAEVFLRFDLRDRMALFSRCINCNTPLEAVRKEEIIDRLQADTSRYFSKFTICPGCNRIFWEGSHYDNMKRIINQVLMKVSEMYDKKYK
ncbi:twitching motility protein PilT [bacterium]|nr:twitching motility protein PilT [bacterium]